VKHHTFICLGVIGLISTAIVAISADFDCWSLKLVWYRCSKRNQTKSAGSCKSNFCVHLYKSAPFPALWPVNHDFVQLRNSYGR